MKNFSQVQLAAVAFAAGALAAISLKPGLFSAAAGLLLVVCGGWVSSTPLAFMAAGWVAAAAQAIRRESFMKRPVTPHIHED